MTMLGAALSTSNPSVYLLFISAVLSGAGGGAFASSMNNISYFFPKHKQGLGIIAYY
jgi:MFS transporter, NNP family, nitrate/nitrite transporter